jgi:drug/metabolite transporter (DMT)-like permease
VGRNDDIEAIVSVGRRTRAATPRWLWIAAAIVGVICLAGFAVVVLGDAEPRRPAVERRDVGGGGFGTGFALGACAGLLLGLSIARQRRDHSSRSRP